MENLYEILKNSPKGLTLYSPIIGDVELTSIYEEEDRRIIEVSCHDKHLTLRLDEFGRFLGAEVECILFPSGNYKCWDGWQRVLASRFAEGVLFTNHIGNLIWVCGNKVTDINMNSKSIFANAPLGCLDWNGLGWNGLGWNGLDFATPEDYITFHYILDSKGFVCEHGQIKAIARVGFNDGDILYDETSNAILIFSHVSAGEIMDYASYSTKGDRLFHGISMYGSVDGCKLRMATPEEVKLLLQKLAENHIGWDAENKKLISLKDVDFSTWLLYQPSYGIYPPPMTQEDFERFLNMYLFDKPYISSISISDAQYRTELLDAILTKHSKKYRKERK